MTGNYRNPLPTVDLIIEIHNGIDEIRNGIDNEASGEAAMETGEGILLIQRKNPPYGWALPGGFVDYGESFETAAVREAMEETSLAVTLLEQFYTYSAPDRDPRQHTVTTVYIARATGIPRARDDASALGIFRKDRLPTPIAFDHALILQDYYTYRAGGGRPDIRLLEGGSGSR